MKTELLCCVALLMLAVSAPGQDSKGITATNGQEFKVTLAANPTTGYSWALAKPLDEKIVKCVTNEYVRSAPQLIGSGGTAVWTFKAVGEGKTEIGLKYARPWETNVAPARTTNFAVVVLAPKLDK
jgi:inhibitor of cysteine peptidase